MEQLEPRSLPATITLQVTTTEDVVDEGDNVLSLREAIDAARQNVAGNEVVIQLSAEIYKLTRDFVPGVFPPDDENRWGDLDVDASGGKIVIRGVADGASKIDAYAEDAEGERLFKDRVFHVLGGEVVFERLTIGGGFANNESDPFSDVYGGGVLVNSGPPSAPSKVTFIQSTLENNTANNVSDIHGTAAYGGGVAIHVGVEAIFDHTSVLDNRALGAKVNPNAPDFLLVGGDAFGGGIYFAGARLTMYEGDLSYNQAKGGSGAGGGPSVEGQPGGNAEGGAIFVAGGDVLLDGFVHISITNDARGGSGGSGGNGGTPSPGPASGERGGDGGRGGNARGGGVFVAAGQVRVPGTAIDGETYAGNGGNGGNGGRAIGVVGVRDGAAGRGGDGGLAQGGAIYVATGASLFMEGSAYSTSFGIANGGDGGRGGLLGGGDGGNGGLAQGGAIYFAGAALALDLDDLGGGAHGGSGGDGGIGISDEIEPGYGGIGGQGGDGEGGALFLVDGRIPLSVTRLRVGSARGGSGGNGGKGGSRITGAGGATGPALAGGRGGDGGNGRGAAFFLRRGFLTLSHLRDSITPDETTVIADFIAEGGSGGNGGDGGDSNAIAPPASGGAAGGGGDAFGGVFYLSPESNLTLAEPLPVYSISGDSCSPPLAPCINEVVPGPGGQGGLAGISALNTPPDPNLREPPGQSGEAAGVIHFPDPLTFSQVRGQAWFDQNGNGVREAGEPPLPSLYGEAGPASFKIDLNDAAGESIGRVDTSLLQGQYAFHTTYAGDAFVQFDDVPPGFVISSKDSGDDATDSDAFPATRRTDVFALSPGNILSNMDVGMWYSPTVPFAPAAVLGDAPGYDVHSADIDGDGDSDIFARLGRTGQPGFRYVWYQNLGGGAQFEEHEVFVLDTINNIEGFSRPLADLDGDQDLDLFLHDRESYFWLRNTGGAFEMARVISTEFLDRLQAFDLDADGDLDLLGETIDADEMLPFFENQGDGNFSPMQLLAMQGPEGTVEPSDLDGDGDIDFLRIGGEEENQESEYVPLPFVWLENNGADPPGFVAHTLLEAEFDDSPFVGPNADAEDLDGDGDLDIAALINGYIAWFENRDGAGAFGPAQVVVESSYGSITIADVDGDGAWDVLTDYGAVRWFQNSGGTEPFLSHVIDSPSVSGSERPSPVQAADLDGDGDQDVIAAWIVGEQGIHIYRNDATTAPDILDVAPDPRTTVVGAVTIIFPDGASGVDAGDFSLTRDGASVDLSGLSVVQDTPRRFTIDLSSVTSRGDGGDPGHYELILNLDGAGIVDDSGQVLTGAVADSFVIAPPFQNTDTVEDVDADGEVRLSDLLVLVQWLRENDSGELPPPDATHRPPPFLDVTGDNVASLADLVQVVQYLRSAIGQQSGEAEGESDSTRLPPPAPLRPEEAGDLESYFDLLAWDVASRRRNGGVS